MKTDNLIPAAPLDRRELAPGVQLCFTRLDAPLCPPPLDWPRLLVFDFCRSGRRAIPDGAQYAIVTEGHAAVSFAVPGADFYLPGSQYEALQLFIDPDATNCADWPLKFCKRPRMAVCISGICGRKSASSSATPSTEKPGTRLTSISTHISSGKDAVSRNSVADPA